MPYWVSTVEQDAFGVLIFGLIVIGFIIWSVRLKTRSGKSGSTDYRPLWKQRSSRR